MAENKLNYIIFLIGRPLDMTYNESWLIGGKLKREEQGLYNVFILTN